MKGSVRQSSYGAKDLLLLSFDIQNDDETLTGQPIGVIDQIYDTNAWEWTTSYFQAFDVALAPGTNVITIHATDLAGNTRSTSLTIYYDLPTSAPTLNVEWPTNNAGMSGSTFDCVGTVSDPTATVEVHQMMSNGTDNFTCARVGRDGRFYALGMNLSGVTNIEVSAIDAAENTTTTPIAITQDSSGLSGSLGLSDAQSGIYMSSYHSNYSLTCNGYTRLKRIDHWDDMRGGWQTNFEARLNAGWTITWPASTWPQTPSNGTYTQYHTPTGEQAQQWSVGWPGDRDRTGIIDTSKQDVDLSYSKPEYGYQIKEFVQKSFSLATGGPLGSAQKNLWLITASATAYEDEDDEVGTEVPSTNIYVGTFGHLDTNGQLWLPLSDNDGEKLTVKVLAENGKTVLSVNAVKYTLSLNASSGSSSGPSFCVGQAIDLNASFSPSPSMPFVSNVKANWHSSGDFVNDSNAIPQSYYYFTNTSKLHRDYNPSGGTYSGETTRAWWTTGGYKTVSIGMNLQFTNGRCISIAAKTAFNMYRPTPYWERYWLGGSPGLTTTNGYLSVTNWQMSFKYYLKSTFSGKAFFTQLISGTQQSGLYVHAIPSNSLDEVEEYWGYSRVYYSLTTNENEVSFADGPCVSLPVLGMTAGGASMNLSFNTFLRFEPSGDNSIPVTLEKVKWGVVAVADWTGWTPSGWELQSGSQVSAPSNAPCSDFPIWTNVVYNSWW